MAVDIFLKVDGIDGDSADDRHPKWITATGFQFRVSRAVSESSGRPRAAQFESLEVVKAFDIASPDLSLKCANGGTVKKVELECCSAGQDSRAFVKITLENCVVTSVAVSGSADDESRPLETVAFAYSRITWEYTPVDRAGRPGAPISRAWDLQSLRPA